LEFVIEKHLSTDSFNGCKYHLLHALGAYTLTEIETYFAEKIFSVTNRLLPLSKKNTLFFFQSVQILFHF